MDGIYLIFIGFVTLLALIGIFWVVWSPSTLPTSGKSAPILSFDDDDGYGTGLQNGSILARKLLEMVLKLFLSIFILAWTVVAMPFVLVIQNWRTFFVLVTISVVFYAYQHHDAESKMFIDNSYSGYVYPVLQQVVAPIVRPIRPYASLYLVWQNAFIYASKIAWYQFFGILWDATMDGEIAWSPTVDAFGKTITTSSKEIVRVLFNGIIFSDLNVSLPIYHSTAFVLSLTDKTKVLCKDANFLIELAIEPLGYPEFRYAATDIVNATWMHNTIWIKWTLDLQKSGPPELGSVFDQLITGTDHAGIWIDNTLVHLTENITNAILDVVDPDASELSIPLPPLGVTVAKVAILAIRVNEFVLQGVLHAPYWFGKPPGSDPINGYLPRELLGITALPSGDPSFLEKVLTAADDVGDSLGAVVGFFYNHAGRVVVNLERLITDLVRFVVLVTAHVILAAKGQSNFATFLSEYSYGPIRTHLQELSAAVVDLVTPYYEPAGYVIFSGVKVAYSVSWLIYRTLIHVGLLGEPVGVAYFENDLTSTMGFQIDFEAFLTDIDAFAGSIGGLISSFVRFTPGGIIDYNAKRFSSTQNREDGGGGGGSGGGEDGYHQDKPDPTFNSNYNNNNNNDDNHHLFIPKAWKMTDIPIYSDYTNNNNNNILRDDPISSGCSNMSILCYQACNDWCDTSADACAPDPWPSVDNRSTCLYGIPDTDTEMPSSLGCINVCMSECNYNQSFCITDACNLVFVGTCIGQSRAQAVANSVTIGCGSSTNAGAETRCTDGNILCCFGGLTASVFRFPVGILRWTVRLCYSIGNLNRTLPTFNLVLNPVRDFIGYIVCILSKIYLTIAHPESYYYIPSPLCFLTKITCVIADIADMALGILSHADVLFDVKQHGSTGYFPDIVVAILLPNLYNDLRALWTCSTSTLYWGYNPLQSIFSGLASLQISLLSLSINVFKFLVSIGIEIYRAITFPEPGVSDADRFFIFMFNLAEGQSTDLHDIKASIEDVAASIASIFLGIYEPFALLLFDAFSIVTHGLWLLMNTLAHLPGLFGGNRWNGYFTNPNGFLYDLDAVFDRMDATSHSFGAMISGLSNLVVFMGGTVPFKRGYGSESTVLMSDYPMPKIVFPESHKGFTETISSDTLSYMKIKRIPIKNVVNVITDEIITKLKMKDNNNNLSAADGNTSTNTNTNTNTNRNTLHSRDYSTGFKSINTPTIFDDEICASVCNAVCYSAYKTDEAYFYGDRDPNQCFVITASGYTIDPVYGHSIDAYIMHSGCYYTCSEDCSPGCSGCGSNVACQQMCALSCSTSAGQLPSADLDSECSNPHFNAAQEFCSSKLLCCLGGTFGSALRIFVSIIRYAVHLVISPLLPSGYNIPKIEWILDAVSEFVSYSECTLGRMYQVVLLTIFDDQDPIVDEDYLPPLMCVGPSVRCVVGDLLLLTQDILIHAKSVFSDNSSSDNRHYFKINILGVAEYQMIDGVRTPSYVVSDQTTSYRVLIASVDGLCECIGSVFDNVYHPLSMFTTAILKMYVSLPRILVRIVTEFVQNTPDGSIRNFFLEYDYDGFGAAYEDVGISLAEFAGDVYVPFQIIVRYAWMTIDTFISIWYNTLLNIDILFDDDGYFITEVLGTADTPFYDPSMLQILQSNLRNMFYGVRLLLNGIWSPLSAFIFDIISLLISWAGFFLGAILNLILNTSSFPNYMINGDYNQGFLYFDKLAVSSGNLFRPIHTCVPNIVTSSVRTVGAITSTGIEIVGSAPGLLTGGNLDNFATKIFAKATDAVVQFERIGQSIAVLLQYFGSQVEPGDCSAAVPYGGSNNPGDTTYEFNPYDPPSDEDDSGDDQEVDAIYTDSNTTLCSHCCKGCCVDSYPVFFMNASHFGDSQGYFDNVIAKDKCSNLMCGNDCKCKCPDICAGHQLNVGIGMATNGASIKCYITYQGIQTDYFTGIAHVRIDVECKSAYEEIKCPLRGTDITDPLVVKSGSAKLIRTDRPATGNVRNVPGYNWISTITVLYDAPYYCNSPANFMTMDPLWMCNIQSSTGNAYGSMFPITVNYNTGSYYYDRKKSSSSSSSSSSSDAFSETTSAWKDTFDTYTQQVLGNMKTTQLKYVTEMKSKSKSKTAAIVDYKEKSLDLLFGKRTPRTPDIIESYEKWNELPLLDGTILPNNNNNNNITTFTTHQQSQRDASCPSSKYVCSRTDLYSCSQCVCLPSDTMTSTLTVYSLPSLCIANCQGSAGTYPLCTQTNTIPPSYYNVPPSITSSCGSSSTAAPFCCIALFVSGGFGLGGSVVRFGLQIGKAISDDSATIPVLTEIIDKIRVLLNAVACVTSFPFMWDDNIQDSFANLTYTVLNLITIPIDFLNRAIMIVLHYIGVNGNIDNLTDLASLFITPIFNVPKAFINWMRSASMISAGFANILNNIIDVIRSAFLFLANGVLTLIVKILNFIISLFAFFSNPGGSTSGVLSTFKDLFINTFASFIGGIIEAFAELLFPGIWNTLKSLGGKIVSFFSSFANCFSSADAFGNCLWKIIKDKINPLNWKRNIIIDNADRSYEYHIIPRVKCLTCDTASNTVGDDGSDGDGGVDVDIKTSSKKSHGISAYFNVVGSRMGNIKSSSSRSAAAALVGVENGIKRRALAVRPNGFFPSISPIAKSKFTKNTGGKTAVENGGWGYARATENLPEYGLGGGGGGDTSSIYSPFGASFEDELPAEYIYFLKTNMSAMDPGFAKLVYNNWPFEIGSSFSSCDAVVETAAVRGFSSLTETEKKQYIQCVTTLFVTRIVNWDNTKHNNALHSTIVELQQNNLLKQNEYGDYMFEGDDNIYEAEYEYTIPDLYFINPLVQKNEDINIMSGGNTNEASVAIRTLLMSPEYYYYQQHEYVPPQDRGLEEPEITSSSSKTKSKSKSKSNNILNEDITKDRAFTGRFEFYIARHKTSSVRNANKAQDFSSFSSSSPHSRIIDPDYDPLYDYVFTDENNGNIKSRSENNVNEKEWVYDYAPRGKIQYADLVAGILDAHGIYDQQLIHRVIKISKKLSPKYYGSIIDSKLGLNSINDQNNAKRQTSRSKLNDPNTINKGDDTDDLSPPPTSITWTDISEQFMDIVSSSMFILKDTSEHFEKKWDQMESDRKHYNSRYAGDNSNNINKINGQSQYKNSNDNTQKKKKNYILDINNNGKNGSITYTTTVSSSVEPEIPPPPPLPSHMNKFLAKLTDARVKKYLESTSGDQFTKASFSNDSPLYEDDIVDTTDLDVITSSKLLREQKHYIQLRVKFFTHRGITTAPSKYSPTFNSMFSSTAGTTSSSSVNVNRPHDLTLFYTIDDSTSKFMMRPRTYTTTTTSPTLKDRVPFYPDDIVHIVTTKIKHSGVRMQAKVNVFEHIRNRLAYAKYPLANAYNYIVSDHHYFTPEFRYAVVPQSTTHFSSSVPLTRARESSPFGSATCESKDDFFSEVCVRCALLGGSLEAFVDLFVTTLNKTSIILDQGPIPLNSVYSQEDIDNGRPQDVSENIRNMTYDISITKGPTQNYTHIPYDYNRFNLIKTMVTFIQNLFYKAEDVVLSTAGEVRHFFSNTNSSDPNGLLYYIVFSATCEIDSLDCSDKDNNGLGLVDALLLMTTIYVTLFMISVIFFPCGTAFLVNVLITILFLPTLYMIAYSVSPGCWARGYVPECIPADIEYMINNAPSKIPWPEYLVINKTTTGGGEETTPIITNNSVVEYRFVACARDRNFYDGLDSLAFLILWKWEFGANLLMDIETAYVDPLVGTNRTVHSYFSMFNVSNGNADPVDVWCFYESLPTFIPWLMLAIGFTYVSYIVILNLFLIPYRLLRIFSIVAAIINEGVITWNGEYATDVVMDYNADRDDDDDDDNIVPYNDENGNVVFSPRYTRSSSSSSSSSSPSSSGTSNNSSPFRFYHAGLRNRSHLYTERTKPSPRKQHYGSNYLFKKYISRTQHQETPPNSPGLVTTSSNNGSDINIDTTSYTSEIVPKSPPAHMRRRQGIQK